MRIERTVKIDDITPQEAADYFLSQDNKWQAAFFNAFKTETDKWRGAGWCQQCCSISEYLDSAGIEAILKLGEWAAEPYRKDQTHA